MKRFALRSSHRFAVSAALCLLFGSGIAAARTNQALQFVVSAGAEHPHVEITAQAPFNVTEALTVEAWVKLKDYPVGEFPPKWQGIVTKGESWGLTRHSNTNRLAFRTAADGALHTLASVTELIPGEWTHVAVVWDGATKAIYLNGELDAGEAWESAPDSNAFRVMIGTNEEYPARVYEGGLDEVRVWSTARAAADIRATMRRRLRGSEPGLLGCWQLDTVNDGADGVLDASLNNHHGTLYDLTADTASVAGLRMGTPPAGEHALGFNGIDQYVQLANEPRFDFEEAMTMEADIFLNAYPTSQTALISKGTGAWELSLNPDGTLSLQANGLTPATLTSASALPVDAWHHVAVVWNSAMLALYIDGNIDTWQLDVSGTIATNELPVHLGARPVAAGDPQAFFEGALDNVRLWRVARTAQQITENRTRALGGRGPGLAGAWDFNEGGGDIAADGRGIIEPASDTLDFEALPAGNQGTTVVQGDYEVTVPAETQLVAADSAGSVTLYVQDIGETVTLRRGDGLPFRLKSIAVANFAADAEAGAQVTFEGLLPNGAGTVAETVALAAGGDMQTVEFITFNEVVSVSWEQEAAAHRFDTIVLHPLVGMPASQVKADGRLVAMPSHQRQTGARDLGIPLPANYAVRFDGIDDYLQAPHDDALNLDEFTLEAWVRPEASMAEPGQVRTLLRKGDLGYGLAIDSDGRLLYFAGDGSVGDAIVSTETVSDGEWQHVAVTVSPSTNTVRFYINGSPAGDAERNDVLNNADPLVFGRLGYNTDAGYLHGDLTEIRIWDHARSADDVAMFANQRLPAVLDGLLAYWPFSKGTGAVAADSTDAARTAQFETAGGSDLAQWVHGPSAPFREEMYSLYFDGDDDFLEIAHNDRFAFADALTIETWVRPQANNTEDGLRTLVMKGDNNAETAGYGLALDTDGHLCYWVDENTANLRKSTATVQDDAWQHVAVVVDKSIPSTRFYINGVDAGGVAAAILHNNTESLLVGRQGTTDATARNHFRGWLDELRIWNTARSPEQIAAGAHDPLPGSTLGLVGYWRLDDYADYLALTDDEKLDANALLVTDLTADIEAPLRNMGISAWHPGLSSLAWDGPFWDTESLPAGMNLSANAAARGLWIGTVTLDRVTDIRTARSDYDGELAETTDLASFTILFHVDDQGRPRLLKEVTVMQEVADANEAVDEEDLADDAVTRLVLVTDPLRIPQFEGVVVRRGKLVGQRYGTVAYDFDGYEKRFNGGLGAGNALRGEIVLARTHPTNPFRHKFHPDHRNVSDIDPDHGYEIVREMSIRFSETGLGDEEPGGYGIDRIRGIYNETVHGLHKFPIDVEGTVTLNRVCDVGVINE